MDTPFPSAGSRRRARRPGQALLGAAAALGMLWGCGDPGPYGYGTTDDASHAEHAPHSAHAAHASSGGAVPKGVIRGVIDVADAPEPGTYACVFLMGRHDPSQRVPELVQKLPAGPFPIAFEVSARDLAGPGTLSGEWYLDARLDQDGIAFPQAGDVSGRTASAVAAGAGGVVLLLDQAVTETVDPGLLDLSAHRGGTGHAAVTATPGLGDGRGLPPGHPPLDGAGASAMPNPHTSGAIPLPDPHAGHDHGPGEGHDSHAPAATGPRFRGKVEVDASLAAAAQGGTLYVMIKQAPNARGMPRAVLALQSPTFPLTFDIGPEHVPLDVDNKADMLLGTLYVSARLDKDGNAMTKLAGDLEMSAADIEATANGDPVVIRLDTERTQ